MNDSLRKYTFTLMELLIVIAIIGILLSLLLPSLGKAAYIARNAMCLSNLSQNGKSTLIYTKDKNGHLMKTMNNPMKPIRAYYLYYRGNTAGLAILNEEYTTPAETFYCPQYDYQPNSKFRAVDAQKMALFTYKNYLDDDGVWGLQGDLRGTKLRSGYYYLTGESKAVSVHQDFGHIITKYENDEILFSDSTQNYNAGAHCKYKNMWNVLKMDLSAKPISSNKTASILSANPDIFGNYVGQYEIIIEELSR